MSKLLYSTVTEKTYPYPRFDNEPVIGLSEEFMVLDKIEMPRPNDEFQYNSKYVIDLDLLEYRLEWELIEPAEELPQANWDTFNGAMLSDPVYQQAVGSVLQIAPGLATALPAALSLVATNGVGAFSLVWSNFCAVAEIPQSQREQWSAIAEANNLPIEFVSALRGTY